MLHAILAAILLASTTTAPSLPGPLEDIDGDPVDLEALAEGDQRIFAVTLRSASCAVCARQLVRLERQRAGLELCGARFLVLSPGPTAQIERVRRTTGLRARFIEDRDGDLARALGLVLRPGQMVPAILELSTQGRVLWKQRGRSGGSFGDAALQAHLRCEQREI